MGISLFLNKWGIRKPKLEVLPVFPERIDGEHIRLAIKGFMEIMHNVKPHSAIY